MPLRALTVFVTLGLPPERGDFACDQRDTRRIGKGVQCLGRQVFPALRIVPGDFQPRNRHLGRNRLRYCFLGRHGGQVQPTDIAVLIFKPGIQCPQVIGFPRTERDSVEIIRAREERHIGGAGVAPHLWIIAAQHSHRLRRLPRTRGQPIPQPPHLSPFLGRQVRNIIVAAGRAQRVFLGHACFPCFLPSIGTKFALKPSAAATSFPIKSAARRCGSAARWA